MIVGVEKVICTCGKDMRRTGGVFGEITTGTYYCGDCQKHIIVVTPKRKGQEEFVERLAERGVNR